MRKGWNCLAWRRLRGDSYVKGKGKEDGARPLSVESGDRTRDSRGKLKHKRFCLNIRKYF